MILCLGTAQLGLAYGVNNQAGLLSEEAAQAVLLAAWQSGFTMLDTSSAYGLAGERIKRFLAEHPYAFTVQVRDAADTASVYTPEDALASNAECIQVPANALDGRMDKVIPALRAKGKRVFVRSLLLQGLLASDPDEGPKGNLGNGAFVAAARGYIYALRAAAADYSIGIVEMCIRWAWELGPDVAIVGCETPDQARLVGRYWKRGPLPPDLVILVRVIRRGVPEHVISPRMWKQSYDFTPAT